MIAADQRSLFLDGFWLMWLAHDVGQTVRPSCIEKVAAAVPTHTILQKRLRPSSVVLLFQNLTCGAEALQ